MMIRYVVIALLVVSMVSGACSFVTTVSSVNETMTAVAQEAANSVQQQMANSLMQIEMIGMIPELGGDKLTHEEKQAILNQYAAYYGWNGNTIVMHTAEETSAIREQLAAQAENLKTMIERFRFRQ